MATCDRCKLKLEAIEGGCNDHLCPQLCPVEATELFGPHNLTSFFSGNNTPIKAESTWHFDPNKTQPMPIYR